MTNSMQQYDDRRPAEKASTPAAAFTRKEFIAIVVMPLVMLILTVVSANLIASRVQERSFRRSELFKARLQRIVGGQDDARRVRRDVEEAFRIMRSREEYARSEISGTPEDLRAITRSDYYRQIVAAPALQTLRRSKIELDALAEDLGGSEKSPIRAATDSYGAEVEAFVSCWNGNSTLGQRCADTHSGLIEKIQAVVVAYGRRADEFINDQDKR